MLLLASPVSPEPEQPQPTSLAEDWFVRVPNTNSVTAEQASRSVASALRAGARRIVVEAGIPEFEPSSEHFRLTELVDFTQALAEPLLQQRGLMPVSRPHVKVLFDSASDATLAGAMVLTTDMPISVLTHPNAFGPRDGAYIIVAPTLPAYRAPTFAPQASTASSSMASSEARAWEEMARKAEDEARQEVSGAAVLTAMERVFNDAGSRAVIVVNPRLGNFPPVDCCEPAYVLRSLEFSYLRDQYAEGLKRARACLLRCFPHEWSVLVDAEGVRNARLAPTLARPAAAKALSWAYAGRFSRRPNPTQMEKMVETALTRERYNAVREAEQ